MRSAPDKNGHRYDWQGRETKYKMAALGRKTCQNNSARHTMKYIILTCKLEIKEDRMINFNLIKIKPNVDKLSLSFECQHPYHYSLCKTIYE